MLMNLALWIFWTGMKLVDRICQNATHPNTFWFIQSLTAGGHPKVCGLGEPSFYQNILDASKNEAREF